MSTTTEEVTTRLGFATDDFDKGLREVKAKVADAASHISEHMERPRAATTAFHHALREVTAISPLLGEALQFAFNPVVGGITAAVMGLKLLKDHMDETRKLAAEAAKEMAAHNFELDKSQRAANASAASTVEERKRAQKKWEDSQRDEQDPVLARLAKERTATEQAARERKENEADARRTQQESLRAQEQGISDQEHAIRERYAAERRQRDEAFAQEEHGIRRRFELLKSETPAAEHPALAMRQQDEIYALQERKRAAHDAGQEEAELDALQIKRQSLLRDQQQRQHAASRAEVESENKDRASERAALTKAIGDVEKERSGLESQLTQAKEKANNPTPLQEIKGRKEHGSMLEAEQRKLEKQVIDREGAARSAREKLDELAATPVVDYRLMGRATQTKIQLQKDVDAYAAAKEALEKNKREQDELITSTLELKHRDEEAVDAVAKLQKQIDGLTSAHRRLREELDKAPTPRSAPASASAPDKSAAAKSNVEAASGAEWIPGENWAARSQRLARMTAEERKAAAANIPKFNQAAYDKALPGAVAAKDDQDMRNAMRLRGEEPSQFKPWSSLKPGIETGQSDKVTVHLADMSSFLQSILKHHDQGVRVIPFNGE